MQAFFPVTSVKRSFRLLDNRRLIKQHLELHQLIDLVARKERGEKSSHHAAVNLFMGHSDFLRYCFATCVYVCLERGINIKTYRSEYEKYRAEFGVDREQPFPPELPEWFGRKVFHSAHRQALLAKSLARKLKAEWELDRLAEYGNGPVSHKEYDNAIAEWQWYRSLQWPEDPRTTIYTYYWWDYKKQRLYAGPERDAMDEGRQ